MEFTCAVSRLPESITLGLALFSPGYVGVSNGLGLRVWRIHVHLWHQTENTGLGFTARENHVVKWTLAVKDPGARVWEAIPRSLCF